MLPRILYFACSNPSHWYPNNHEHEVFQDCCHFYPFDIFAKKCENNEKIMTFNYKIYNLHSFLVSNTINMLI